MTENRQNKQELFQIGEVCKAMGEKLPKALEGSTADAMGLFVTPAS